ncbi:MAG: DNA/RNA non-specific endonuclease [Ekhidna sp.]|nr:DNA/RNA non-specific endonuclease [Ekhidna sp.]
MKKLFFTLLFGFNQLGVAQRYLPKSTGVGTSGVKAHGELVQHSYYTLSYLEDFEQAEWVYYVLNPEMLKGSTPRTDNFRADPNISTGSAQLADYKNSGFDRGHLVPAGDMKVNNLAMSESFYLSNVSPQSTAFNRGIWKKLETLIREWAGKEEVHIVTGGILITGLKEIGINKVDVPKHFYKVLYAPKKGKMIAFVLPNERGQKVLSAYVVSVDTVEKLTNIDFFPQLVDEVEERLESKVNLSNWTFSISKPHKTSKSGSITSSSQCIGIAKSTGFRCKNKTKKENGYCHAHQSQSPDYVKPKPVKYFGRCNATTQKGIRCKRNASSGSYYCWQHQ